MYICVIHFIYLQNESPPVAAIAGGAASGVVVIIAGTYVNTYQTFFYSYSN